MAIEASTKGTDSPGVLVAFAPFAILSPHFETDLEIMQDHLDKGDRVVALSCMGELKTCDPNPGHSKLICMACQNRFRNGMHWVRGQALTHEPFYELTPDEESAVDELGRRKWQSLDDLRQFKLDGADLGMAVVSSIVSWSREPNPNPERYAEMIGRNLASAAMVHFSLRRKLRVLEATGLSIFNARVASLRPALRAAQAMGIESLVHERAGYPHRYAIARNTYPHDLAAIKRDIENCFEASTFTADDRILALEWYEERKAGVAQNWHSFVAGQERDRLPPGIDASKLNVAVFISSEDEYVSVEEWDNPHYPNQNDGIARLLSDLADDPRIRIFLRVHPNLANIENSQVDELRRLTVAFPNLIIIPADSSIASYSLIDAVDLIICYGSTVGIEACYAGKPSVLMGRAMYEDLDVCIKPATHHELIQLIRDASSGSLPERPSGRQLGLLKYGHYNRVGGIPYRHVVPQGLFAARMKTDAGSVSIGQGVLVGPALKALRWLRSLCSRLTS